MKKLLLVFCLGTIGISLATAGEPTDPTPFGKKNAFTIKQDAPVYPNPARDHIILHLAETAPISNQNINVEIRNILGNKMPVQLESISGGKFRISLSEYPSGYYLLVLRCERCGDEQGHHEEIHKFLKQ
ncbi:MAG: T9SS type A sorting domain-containing protein [Tunicatimonas sp.]